jgi:uncharacterized protein (TIGR02145 family)
MPTKLQLFVAALVLLLVAASCSTDEPSTDPIVDDPVAELSVDPANISARPEGGSYTLAVTSNVAWTATVNAAWLTLNPGNGNGNATVTVRVEENTTDTRNATISLTAGSLTRTVTVTQDVAPPAHAVTPKTWVIGSQTWSDAIHIPECNKEDFGESLEEPRCRSYTEEGANYYYYNWAYVIRHAATLCPSPWRVPDSEDFIALDLAMDGTGENRTETPEWVEETYVQTWGGSYGGLAISLPDYNGVGDIGTGAYYWSTSDYSDNNAYALNFNTNGDAHPQSRGTSMKPFGFRVRCVK